MENPAQFWVEINTLQKKYMPMHLDDLVFADAYAEKIVREYALGLRTRSLLLHGPTGSGKTSAGRMIMEHCMPGFSDMTLKVHLTARLDNEREDWLKIDEFLTSLPFNRGYLQIDDVEYYRPALFNHLDGVLETDKFGTLILTAENIADIDGWALSRCEVVQLLLPSAEQYQARALTILRSEGLDASEDDVARLLHGFTGNWYALMRHLENYLIEARFE